MLRSKEAKETRLAMGKRLVFILITAILSFAVSAAAEQGTVKDGNGFNTVDGSGSGSGSGQGSESTMSVQTVDQSTDVTNYEEPDKGLSNQQVAVVATGASGAVVFIVVLSYFIYRVAYKGSPDPGIPRSTSTSGVEMKKTSRSRRSKVNLMQEDTAEGITGQTEVLINPYAEHAEANLSSGGMTWDWPALDPVVPRSTSSTYM